VHSQKSFEFKHIIQEEQRRQQTNVTVVFVIRRAGCGACREHALQLAQVDNEDLKVNMLGIVKNTKHANHLINFYNDYYKNPIYLDSGWKVFKAMGGRKIVPSDLLRKHLGMLSKRYRENEIKNQIGFDDNLTQGGVLIFDRNAELRFTYYETYGEILDLDIIRSAITKARQNP